MQYLWLEDLDWDENVSADSYACWKNLVSGLPHIENISIPKLIQYHPIFIRSMSIYKIYGVFKFTCG